MQRVTLGKQTDINISTFWQHVAIATETDFDIITFRAVSDTSYRDRHQYSYVLICT